MSATQNQYSLGLDKTPANYVALTPLSFLARTAAIYPASRAARLGPILALRSE